MSHINDLWGSTKRRLEDSLSFAGNQVRRVEDSYFEKRDKAILERLRALQKNRNANGVTRGS